MLSKKQVSVVIISSIITAILLTSAVAYEIQHDSGRLVLSQDNTILDNHKLITSLQSYKAYGGVIAIHGYKHENYSLLSDDQIQENLVKSKYIFGQAGLTTNVFVSPYEISEIPETSTTNASFAKAGITIPFNGATVYEYTWDWKTHNTINSKKAVAQINVDKPHIIVVHTQDWNTPTKKLLTDYLSATSDRNIIVRLDDVSVNTPDTTINEFAKLSSYKSVGTLFMAIIPVELYIAGNEPVINNIPVNTLMKGYFGFFIVSALFPMSFFVCCMFIRGRVKERKEPQLPQPDLVTIIVPAYNEEKSIARCIEALLSQDYDGAKEIIVVNDGSTDNTAKIIPQYPVKFLNIKKNAGKANALNEGIKIANGDILIFSDGDSNMAKDAVRNIITTLRENPKADVVTGHVLVNMPQHAGLFLWLFTQCQRVEYHMEQVVARAVQAMDGGVLVAPGPITAVRSHVCEKVQFSDATVVEDADFTVDCLILGMKVIRCPEAKVHTNAPETITSWIKQRDRWWYGNLQVWEQHKKWAIRNPWMVYNYLGFVMSVITVAMMLAIPVLLMQYANPLAIGLTSIIHMAVPIGIYILFNSIFFRKNIKLIPFVIPYIALYSLLRIFVASKLYMCYITGIGMKIKFGSRTIDVKAKAEETNI